MPRPIDTPVEEWLDLAGADRYLRRYKQGMMSRDILRMLLVDQCGIPDVFVDRAIKEANTKSLAGLETRHSG